VGENVTLTFGEFALAEPTLDGWQHVLAQLQPGDYTVVAELFQRAEGAQLEPGAAREVLDVLLPLAARLPRVVASLVGASLREVDGEAIEPTLARQATAGDLGRFIEAAVDANLFGGFEDLVGNLKRLASRVIEPTH